MPKRSTLQNYTKSQLIDIIECLQHNNNVLSQGLDQQYYNALKIINEMNIFNETYTRCKEKSENVMKE